MALRDIIYCIQLILEARVVAWSEKISVKEKKIPFFLTREGLKNIHCQRHFLETS